jgi:hypothetical protein
VRGGTSYVLLRSAAYGRYLALVLEDVPAGHGARRGCRAVQRGYDAPEQEDVLWEAIEEEDGSGAVLMRHRTYRPWSNFDNPSPLMSWVVEAIPPRQDPQELPHVIPVSLPSPLHQTPRADLAEQGSWNLTGLKFS